MIIKLVTGLCALPQELQRFILFILDLMVPYWDGWYKWNHVTQVVSHSHQKKIGRTPSSDLRSAKPKPCPLDLSATYYYSSPAAHHKTPTLTWYLCGVILAAYHHLSFYKAPGALIILTALILHSLVALLRGQFPSSQRPWPFQRHAALSLSKQWAFRPALFHSFEGWHSRGKVVHTLICFPCRDPFLMAGRTWMVPMKILLQWVRMRSAMKVHWIKFWILPHPPLSLIRQNLRSLHRPSVWSVASMNQPCDSRRKVSAASTMPLLCIPMNTRLSCLCLLSRLTWTIWNEKSWRKLSAADGVKRRENWGFSPYLLEVESRIRDTWSVCWIDSSCRVRDSLQKSDQPLTKRMKLPNKLFLCSDLYRLLDAQSLTLA